VQGVQTYRELFSLREFRSLFASTATSIAGITMQMLALSALLYATTGSPLLAALGYLAGNVPRILGAATVMSYADRLPPRALLAVWDCVRAAVAMVQASGLLPLPAIFALILVFGTGDAVASGARAAIIVEILPRDAYVLGRSVLNVSVGAMQVVGFAIGGTVLATLGPRAALLVSAALALVTAGITRLGLTDRRPAGTRRASVRRTAEGNRRLWQDRGLRTLMIAQCVPNGLVVGAEALYVPYAGDNAGALFVAAAGGMLAGDLIVGRWVPAGPRYRLVTPLQVLLAVPYLLFVLHPGVWLAAATVALASFGFASSLGLSGQYVDLLPPDLRGQGLGLVGSGMMTMQAVAAALTGFAAEFTSPAVAMTGAAVASLVVTASLTRPLRRARSSVPVTSSPAPAAAA
jgi:predicted MFS family arabinose efflux permease